MCLVWVQSMGLVSTVDANALKHPSAARSKHWVLREYKSYGYFLDYSGSSSSLCLTLHNPCVQSFVGSFVGSLCLCSDSGILCDFVWSILFGWSLCGINVTGPHVTCDTHVGLLAHVLACSWTHSRDEVTSWGFIKSLSSVSSSLSLGQFWRNAHMSLNFYPCNGFVKTSARISSDGKI